MAGKPNWKRMPEEEEEEEEEEKSSQNRLWTGSNEASVTVLRPRVDMHCFPLNHRKICICSVFSVCTAHGCF